MDVTKIILLFYCISILSIAFDENSGGALKQHEDDSEIKHMIEIYNIILVFIIIGFF